MTQSEGPQGVPTHEVQLKPFLLFGGLMLWSPNVAEGPTLSAPPSDLSREAGQGQSAALMTEIAGNKTISLTGASSGPPEEASASGAQKRAPRFCTRTSPAMTRPARPGIRAEPACDANDLGWE